MTSFDPERVSRAVAAALAGPGGVGLVLKVFGGVPGVTVVPARRGIFRSRPEQVHIGDWRYEVTPAGHVSAAHVVKGIVLADEVLAAGAVAPHIARALGQVVHHHGPTILANIDAAVEALEAGSGAGA
ncbi:DUF5073 family protein [Mycobacterium mantenii]|uniref:DUF5073 domain-containing protein n=1 Tax=Mycobacterium mantenii TaxID=560555 RepID=A0A1A2SYL0_MYCNT|nr:DUF5073 family protein [Mycobacterium mantenii]OBH47548.1 DUF5073 domain-containing protein [Mycobacterium mantenii]OBH48057.1 DUF5073 domain-containing protein [Mycobacterium mantenii]OBH68293.1 DUF5073 domain-containing protein [Mycobacterium mantenii]OBH68852.1 DUF5073 domain-containing protein [Mycobacterium mantenii]